MNSKYVFRGFLGAFLLGLVGTLVWFGFSFFGQLGFYSAPVFGILIPLGFYWLGKSKPTSKKSWFIIFIALLITLVLGAYLGYAVNVYALFLNQGVNPSDIYIADVRNYIFDLLKTNQNFFVYDVIYEIGVGLLASILFAAGTIYFLGRKENKTK